MACANHMATSIKACFSTAAAGLCQFPVLPLIERCKTLSLLKRNVECRVRHAERCEDALFHEVGQRHSADPLDDCALDIHRHAVLHSQTDGSTYTPLEYISEQQGPFQVYDSALSEEAVLAFEYGYATAEPRAMVIWEGQFGDFANGAQVVIDQFLSSGEQKWGRLCGLTLLLPHGYEGQGPEHSSARLERFLQLCADHNMQVCIPTTPAQVFNMLRRQMVRPMRRPLIVMSPKSLLRHPLATSTLEELAAGKFHNVIGEIDDIKPAVVKRVVFCSGKVYYELLEERRKREQKDVAIVRVEQLYPFPHDEMAEVLSQYQHVTDFVWCQEEPQNQGAWYCSQHHFRAAIPKNGQLVYTGRDASSSPAVGYLSVHNKQQQALVNDALTIK